MPLVSVVLPVPKSPVRRTSTGGWRRLANSLPQRVVSSAECVITSSVTRLQLLEEEAAGMGNGGGDCRGERAGLVGIFTGEFGSFAVQIDAQGEDASPVIGLELRGERGEHSGQDVPGTTFCEARIAG